MRLLLVIVFLLLGASAALPAEHPIAVLTHLAGTVRVDGKPARLLQGVTPGARLECTASNSVAILSYVKGGVRVRVCGPQTYTVVASPTAIRGVEVMKPSGATPAPLPEQINLDRIGGARATYALLLRVGRTMDPNRALEWQTRGQYAEFSVAVDGPGLQPWRETRPMRGVLSRMGDDGSTWTTYRYALPPDVIAALKPGVDYEFRLTASERAGVGGQTWVSRFRVVDPKQLAALDALQKRVDDQAEYPSDSTLAMELAQRYLGHDMLFAALRVSEEADASNPYVQDLHRRLIKEAAALQEAQNSRGARGAPTP